jgi:hypothetical protein
MRRLAGALTAAFCGHQADGCVEAAGHVPGRRYVVHGALDLGRPSDQREAGRRIDRVVNCGPAVTVALELQMDQVRPGRGECIVTQPLLANRIGQDNPAGRAGSGDQVRHDLPAFRTAEVERYGLLPFVQPGPVPLAPDGASGQRPMSAAPPVGSS